MDRGELQDLAPARLGDEVLIQYLQGGLDAGSRGSVEAYFAAHPEDLGRLHELQADLAIAEPEPSPVAADAGASGGRALLRWRQWSPAAAATLCLVLVAAGYSGGRLHTRFVWDQSVDEIRSGALDPEQDFRSQNINQLQNVSKEITDITTMVAEADARLGMPPEESAKMRIVAEQALAHQGLYPIRQLAALLQSEDPEVVRRVRRILGKVLRRVTRSLRENGGATVIREQVDEALRALRTEVGEADQARLEALRKELARILLPDEPASGR